MNDFLRFVKRVSNDLVDEDEIIIVKKIYENIDNLYTLKLSDLAEMSYSSSTTIIRFLKRIGFSSYSDFKSRVSLGYEQLSHRSTTPSIEEINQIVENNYDEKIDKIQKIAASLDEKRMYELIHLIQTYKSVTLVGSYMSVEVLYVLLLQLNMFSKPCYFFKQWDMFEKHLKTREEEDLVIFVYDKSQLSEYEKYSFVKPKCVLLDVSGYKGNEFPLEDVYHLLDDYGDTYQAFTYLEQIIIYPINEILGGFENE